MNLNQNSQANYLYFEDSLQFQLFSQTRLRRGYTNTQEHEENLALIASIAHKIGILEIILRNKIDSILSSNNDLWLESLPQEVSDHIEAKQDYSKDKVISSQSLGFWIKVVDYYRIHNQIIDIDFLHKMDFTKYFKNNKNRFSRKRNFRNYHKAKIILELLRLIRNRSFHFENLYKIANNGYPRLNIKITNKYNENIYIAIHPNKIKDFLNDLLISFHKDLVYYAEK